MNYRARPPHRGDASKTRTVESRRLSSGGVAVAVEGLR
jgi:hypothetical protein